MAKKKELDPSAPFNVKNLISKMASEFGDEFVADPDEDKSIQGLPTGMLILDKEIGTEGEGGLPIGKVVEIFGDYATGKTLLGMMAIAEAQRRGGIGILLDVERAYNPIRCAELGVDNESLVVLYPESQEMAYQQIIAIMEEIRGSGFDKEIVMVWDSLAASASNQELDKEIGENTVAANARVNSSAMKKVANAVHKGKAILIIINQIRTNVGVMFGPDAVTAGGKAVRFYSSLRMHAKIDKKIKSEDNKDDIIGMSGYFEIIKNRFSQPFVKCPFVMYFDARGIDKLAGVFDYLLRHKKLNLAKTAEGKDRKGYYILDGYTDTFTENTFNAFLEEHPDVIEKLRKNEL